MQSLNTLDLKIQALLQKRKDLEQKETQLLLKTIRPILGDNFSPALIAAIIKETWSSSSKETQERWLKASIPFQSSSKKSKQNDKNSAKDSKNEKTNP